MRQKKRHGEADYPEVCTVCENKSDNEEEKYILCCNKKVLSENEELDTSPHKSNCHRTRRLPEGWDIEDGFKTARVG